MTLPLVFKAHLRVEIIPEEGVLVLSEDGTRALHGKPYELVVPLIDGAHDADAIADALAGQVEPAKVYYALALLQKNGYVVESTPDIARETAAFWYGMDVEPRAAIAALRAKKVRVRAVGEVDPARLRRALDEVGVGLTADDTADLEVVVTDDYLRAALTEVNARALASGRPWLLVKPAGVEPWIGPLYVPGQTGCHQCLRQRLERNRLVHKFIADKKKLPDIPPLVPASLSASFNAACEIAAVEAAKFLAGAAIGLQGKVLSLDARAWAVQTHRLSKHPGCEACGARVEAKPVPLTLARRNVTFVQDCGHRAVGPDETLQKYQHLVSAITGPVKTLFPSHRADGIAYVYVAGHNSALRIERVDALKRGLRNASAGKGMSDLQAKTSALCEAIERYSGEFTGSEYRITASYGELNGNAIHPREVMRYSERQYREREAWNARGSKYNGVCEPLEDDTRIDWTPVWSLTEERHKYLPTQLVYYGAPASAGCDKFYCMGCSNGNASGNNLEEAVLQGFFELVERDAVALWWYNRLKKPGVDVASFGERHLLDLAAYYGSIGRRVWALDITSDLGIPAFAAVSRSSEGPEERILFGLGCHLEARIALQRAFAEMNQMLAMAEDGPDGKLAIEDDETLSWLKTATIANQPYMTPDDTVPAKRRSDYPELHSGDLLDDILFCRRIVEARGMEMLVLDQTRADIGMPVVKVIVPGLRHFWARFGPGRLYDVPVQMDWLVKPLREDQLNPIPIFF